MGRITELINEEKLVKLKKGDTTYLFTPEQFKAKRKYVASIEKFKPPYKGSKISYDVNLYDSNMVKKFDSMKSAMDYVKSTMREGE